jgi:hypothetical protein
MIMNIGCLILILFLMFIFYFDKSFIFCIKFFFILIELNVHILCNYENDNFTTILMETKSRGFDRSCLGRIN